MYKVGEKMKIVILDGERVNADGLSWDPITSLGECIIYPYTKREDIVDRIKETDVVLSCAIPLKKEVLEEAKNLKLISLFATGFNHIDIDYCRNRGIGVCNVPSYSTQSVVQMTFALLLGLCNRVETHNQHVQAGEWGNGWNHFSHLPIELSGKVLGIIGYGEIGQSVHKLALSFGMKVLIWDRLGKYPEREEFVDFDTLISSCDVLSLHAPLTADNRHLIDEKAIALMKEGVMIINTARGPLVDEEALARGIKDGKIAGVGVDVLSKEPPREGSPLFGLKEVIITPHAAWASTEARIRLIEENGKNIREFFAGRSYHRVDGE